MTPADHAGGRDVKSSGQQSGSLPATKINPTDAELLGALHVLGRWLSSAARDEARARPETAYVDQHASTLGNRRHCAAARRRIAEGAGGAEQVGRRWLLSPAAIDEELARGRLKRAAPPSADADVRDLAAELGLKLVRGGKP